VKSPLSTPAGREGIGPDGCAQARPRTRFSITQKVLAALLLAAVMLAAGLAGDWLLSRPDRIRLDLEKERLRRLHDAILRFKLDRDDFPRDLSELIPAYASADLLRFRPSRRSRAEKAVRWDPRTGILDWSVPFRIDGLFPRDRNFVITIPNLRVAHDALAGVNVFHPVSAPRVLGPEDIVVEAELFQSLTYGWQIEESASASGNGYIHIKEGVGDIIDHIAAPYTEFDPKNRSGDFYNISGSNNRIEAQCFFEVPADGEYFLAGRTLAQRSKCSNVIRVQVDDKPESSLGDNNTEPFVWLWQTPSSRSPVSVFLSNGVHRLKFHTYQDGVKVDQIVLSRKKLDFAGVGIVAGGYPQTNRCLDQVPPLTLSLSVDTLTITESNNPTVFIYVRKACREEMQAKLQVSLDLPGGRERVREYPIALPADTPLIKFPCDVALPRPLDKKEYLLRCRLVAGDTISQERTVVLYHGYDWSVLGPLPFMNAEATGEVENASSLAPRYCFTNQTFSWQRYSDQFSDQFGVMDFGLMFCGRTFDPMNKAALYAYTEIDAARSGDYLLKAQGDDHLVVWVNGTKVASIMHPHATAIRSASHVRVPLQAGRNRVLFRLNQFDSQWQAGIRFRTTDDTVADILGVPFARQSGWSQAR
jgi:hypothetical protein